MREASSLLYKFSGNNSKEKIIYLLGHTFPLSTKQIYEEFIKNYSIDITYQAIHKTLSELQNENIVEKQNETWKLRNEWISATKILFEKMSDNYKGSKNRYDIPSNFEGTLTFEFDSFTDLSVKTGELLTSKIFSKNSDGGFIGTLEYGWWSFKFRFEHFFLLLQMVKNCKNIKCIIRKYTPFGHWIKNQYEKINILCTPLGKNVTVDEDIIIQGDYILEIKIAPEGKKIIEKYWNKWSNLDDTFKDFGLQDEPKIYSTVKITKNPELAKFLRIELEKHFEGKNG